MVEQGVQICVQITGTLYRPHAANLRHLRSLRQGILQKFVIQTRRPIPKSHKTATADPSPKPAPRNRTAHYRVHRVYVYVTPDGNFESGVCKYGDKEIKQRDNTCVIVNLDGTFTWGKSGLKFFRYIFRGIFNDEFTGNLDFLTKNGQFYNPDFILFHNFNLLKIEENGNLISNLVKKLAEKYRIKTDSFNIKTIF